MKHTKLPLISEALLTAAVITALILLVNPFHFIMTSAVTLTIIMILAVAMISFGVFVWREQPRDEREALYGLQAGRVSYFAGAAVLVAAIIVQAFRHHVDIWLALALGAMVLVKLVAGSLNRYR